MKRILVWFLKSFFYLIPAALIVACIYLFVRYVPDYAAILSSIWMVAVSVVYIIFNRWY